MEGLKVLVAVLLLGADALLAPENYSEYRLLEVTADQPGRVQALERLLQREGLVEDAWGLPSGRAGGAAALLVSPTRLDDVQEALHAAALPHSVIWPDVQRVLDAEAANRDRLRNAAAPDLGQVTFQRFMRHEEIEGYLRRLAAEHKDVVTLEELGVTAEGRRLLGARVSLGGEGQVPAVLVEAGTHAREWIAPAAALYLLHQLVEQPEGRALLRGLDWYVLPMMNPDGYEYSHTKNRFWRKNRSADNDMWCRGVDINRNFDAHWMEAGSSDRPCDITFAGPKAFSEPEARALRDFVLAKNTNHTIKVYLALHSFGSFILYPWGHGPEEAADHGELQAIGEKASAAMAAAGAQPFRVGQSAVLLYPSSGGSDDWAKAAGAIPKSYTVELPGGGSNGFDIEESRIADTVRQVFEGLKVFGESAKSL